MDYLSSNEVKEELFGMLTWFHSFCVNHNINYSLCYGTLIGAIRHKDFIPWDDDIDLVVSRDDYNRILNCLEMIRFESGKRYSLTAIELDNSDYPFIKLIDTSIRVKQEHIEDSGEYLWIDIFPFDSVSMEKKEREQVYKQGRHYRSMIERIKYDTNEFTIKNIKSVIKTLGHPVLKLVGAKHYAKKARMIAIVGNEKYSESEFISNVVWGYGESGTTSKEAFSKIIDVEFHGRNFYAMSNYDEFLRKSYGDYMIIPPKDKRIAHGLKAYRVKELSL